ncbi:unnamed protein product [Diamesa serratosioi]
MSAEAHSTGKLPRTSLEVIDSYEDDFEEYDDSEDIFKKLGIEEDIQLTTPTVSLSSTIASVSPVTDSAGSKNNSNSNRIDSELTSNFNSDYEDEEEIDDESNQRYDFSLFHEVIDDVSVQKQKKFKNGTRSSLTFSNQRVREIERDNQRLLAKIMTSGPAGDGAFQKRAPQLSFTSEPKSFSRSSAEVNRKKKQRQIDIDNQLIKRKLDNISRRRPFSNTYNA